MDELVAQALRKWPNVPDCFGWLFLDGRGRWRIGSERETITHAPTIAFIGRNYGSDDRGRWFFQNGPQRVYVELDYTPRVWRITPDPHRWSMVDHIGRSAVPTEIFIDDGGRFVIVASGQVGVLHDHDSNTLMDRLRTEEGTVPTDAALSHAVELYMLGDSAGLKVDWPDCVALLSVEPIGRGEVATRFQFDPHPAAHGLSD